MAHEPAPHRRPIRSVLIGLSAALLVSTTAVARESLIARAPAPAGLESHDAPRPLARQDAETYREVFLLQEAGDWLAARDLIAAVEDPLLLGHVELQRFTAAERTPSLDELETWLRRHPDHPGADRVYRMALDAYPEADIHLPAPVEAGSLGGWLIEAQELTRLAHRPSRRRTAVEQQVVRSWQQELRTQAEHGDFAAAATLLARADVLGLMDPIEPELARWQVAQEALRGSDDRVALDLAAAAAGRAGDVHPELHWTAGLAAWRLGKIEAAARHFTQLARAAAAHPAERGRAAFWAARANLKLRRPERVVPLLEIAGERPRDFYGHLARTVLGRATAYFFDLDTSHGDALDRLRHEPGGRRALALAQIDQFELAAEEIEELARGADEELATALIRLADTLDLPATQVRLAHRLAAAGHYLHGALYPVPSWQPWTGFTIDRALLLAIARAESGFDPDAESQVGAEGLMQLMPKTAAGIARIADFQPPVQGELREPETNLAFGQAYVEHLLNMRGIGDNLVFVLASYNAGPGRTFHWQKSLGAANDPLLFLESIPTTETRVYVKKVLANLWTYRARLGQGQPSLGDLAANHWPSYTGLDRLPIADARY